MGSASPPRALAELGACVVMTSTTSRIAVREAELAAAGHEVSSFVADLTDKEQVRALVGAAVERLGGVDLLVNNAGLSQLGQPETYGSFLDLDLADWQRALDRNFTTAFLLTRAVAPGMVEAGFGRVVNVSSVAAPMQPPRRGWRA